MDASRDTDTYMPFVADINDIKRLYNFLTEQLGEVGISIKGADKVTRKLSIDELVTYDNIDKRRIKVLTFSNAYGNSVRLQLRLNESSLVSMTLSGEHDTFLKVNEFVNEWFLSVRPWYWRLVPVFGFSNLLSYVLPIVTAYYPLALVLDIVERLNVVKQGSAADEFWIPIFFSTIIIAPIMQLYRLVFLGGEFAFGQGERRHKRRDAFRNVVLGSLVVSLLATLLTTYNPFRNSTTRVEQPSPQTNIQSGGGSEGTSERSR